MSIEESRAKRAPKVSSGLRPFTPAERRRIVRAQQRLAFPEIALRRYEETVRERESEIRALKAELARR